MTRAALKRRLGALELEIVPAIRPRYTVQWRDEPTPPGTPLPALIVRFLLPHELVDAARPPS